MPQTVLEQWIGKTTVPTPSKTTLSGAHDGISSTDDDDAAIVPQPEVDALSKGLHHNVTLKRPEKDDITRLKRLNSLLLPIPYPESFYKELANDPDAQALTLLAFWKDDAAIAGKGVLIGAIRCRLLKSPAEPMLYISTLVLLSPYRGLGIASYMLNSMIRQGVQDHGASIVGAHVWEANTAGLEWYEKRGFEESSFEPNYYRKLEPHGAKVMSKSISVLDLVNKIS